MFRKPISDVEVPPGAVSRAPSRPERSSWRFERGAEIAPGRVALKPLGGGSMYEVLLVWDELLHAICVAKVVRRHRPQLVRSCAQILSGPHAEDAV